MILSSEKKQQLLERYKDNAEIQPILDRWNKHSQQGDLFVLTGTGMYTSAALSYGKAISDSEDLEGLYKDDPDLKLLLLDSLSKCAHAYYKAAINFLKPDRSNGIAILSQLDKAIIDCKTALDLCPDIEEFKQNLLEFLSQRARIYGDDADRYFSSGEQKYNNAAIFSYTKSLSDVQSCLQLSPDNVEIKQLLLTSFINRGQAYKKESYRFAGAYGNNNFQTLSYCEKAILDFQAALELNPAQSERDFLTKILAKLQSPTQDVDISVSRSSNFQDREIARRHSNKEELQR